MKSRIHVHRLHNRYRVARDHPDPEALRSRLDEGLGDWLPSLLNHQSVGLAEDESVVLIRRLELDLVLNADWDKTQIARRWSHQFLRELHLVLQSERGEGVVRFAGRAAYAASFIADLLRGDAWGKWYYRRFDGLRMLSLSAALRTMLCDVDEAGGEILRLLSRENLARCMDSLTEQDARRILQRLCESQGSLAAGQVPGRFMACWEAQPATNAFSLTAQRGALLFCVSMAQPDGRYPTPPALAVLQAAMDLARYLTSHDRVEGLQLLALLQAGDAGPLYRRHATAAEVWLPLLDLPAGELKVLVQGLADRSGVDQTANTVTEASLLYTRFGGLFLLLPLLDSLPLQAMTAGWAVPEEGDTVGLLRLLLLMKCLGKSRAMACFYDPLVRRLLGIGPKVRPETIRQWLTRLKRNHTSTLQSAFRVWQRGEGLLGDAYRCLLRVPAKGGAVALAIDGAGGWLQVAGVSHTSLSRLLETLRPTSLETDTRLLVDPAFDPGLPESAGDLHILSLQDERIDGLARQHPPLAETLARLTRLPDELAYLGLPPACLAGRAADLSLSLIAQGLLRALARRLPGFARSSLPYLYDNFLSFGASVEGAESELAVHLTRPPLHMVLNLSGMNRAQYRLSWLPGQVLRLQQEG